MAELARYLPETKWRLVIELDENNTTNCCKDIPLAMDSLLQGDLSKPVKDQLESRPCNPFTGSVISPVTLANQYFPSLDLESTSSSSALHDIQCILSPQGDQFLKNDVLPTVGESTSTLESTDIIAHFMPTRLLLLHPASRLSYLIKTMLWLMC
jgi:hypothetical protein